MKQNSLIFSKSVFMNSVTKLKPKNLIAPNVLYDNLGHKFTVFGDSYNLKNRNVYVVGAGKAVLQMATEIENVLGKKISAGIVSVPWEITKDYPLPSASVLQCFEGAQNNIADENSLLAAKKIKNLITSLDAKSFLIVLLSGGGSALLPDPVYPVKLEEKSDFIKYLSSQGADIKEMNTVRKKLSSLKGGKLALLAHPAQVVTLLISDIIGICPDMVASGPTFENHDAPDAALTTALKYATDDKIPSSILKTLKSDDTMNNNLWKELKISNYVIGDNVRLLNYACYEADENGYASYNLSHIVSGNVNDVATDYCSLISTVCKLLTKSISRERACSIFKSIKNVPIQSDTLEKLLAVKMEGNGICLVAGGEPVVKVSGTGTGGRNQHLALLFSKYFNTLKSKYSELDMFNVFMLSAGTDGMDGPTDAAGAVGYSTLIQDAIREQLNVESYLENCDSYHFFTKFMNGNCHIKIGHTNTNVMDLHLIIIESVSKNGAKL